MSAPILVVGVLASVVLLAPFPGSLSAVLYESIARPLWNVPGIGVPALMGIVALAALLGFLLLHARRLDTARFAQGAAATVGVPLAYMASEGLKLVFAQERPCRVVVELPGCPPIGDWSLPSNHSTVAFALFCAIAVTRTGWPAWLAAALATLVAWGRIAEGVHYPHDVAAGALVGVITVTGAAVLLTGPVRRAAMWARGRAQH